MIHTTIVKQIKKEYPLPNVPEEDLEACLETLDNFVLKYCPSDNMYTLVQSSKNIYYSFLVLEKIFEIPEKSIKDGVTIDSVVNTVDEHCKNFEKIHKDMPISNEDIDYFIEQIANLFLE